MRDNRQTLELVRAGAVTATSTADAVSVRIVVRVISDPRDIRRVGPAKNARPRFLVVKTLEAVRQSLKLNGAEIRTGT